MKKNNSASVAKATKHVGKKMFSRDKKLEEKKITKPLDEIKPDEKFYNVDKNELEEVMSSKNRTSSYWLPETDTPDFFVLQRMMKNINTVCGYITGKALRVNFSEVDGPSKADFAGEEITISIGSMYDHRIPFHMRLNIVLALGIHESWHVKYTTPGMEKLLLQNGLTKNKISRFGFGKTQKVADFDQAGKLFKHPFQTFLSNCVEDRRIEYLGLIDYPGYVYYMEELRKYGLWCNINALLNPAVKPDWNNQDQFYNALTMYIGFKNVAPEILPVFADFGPKTKEFKALTDKVDVICKNVPLTYDDSLAQSLELLKLYPDEQKNKQAQQKGCNSSGCKNQGSQMAKGTAADGKSVKPSKDEKEAIGDVKDNEQPYATSEQKEIKIEDRFDRTDQYSHVHIEPAAEGRFDQGVFDQANEIARQISKNLSFLDSRFNRVQEAFEMRNGELDEDAIFGLKFNKDIFYEEEDAPGYSMDFGILIDESGSMHGSKIRDAKIAALALAIALKDNKHINLYVYGHTANTGSHPITMYKYFDHTEKGSQDISTLFSVEARANNADGYAISAMGDILNKGKSRQKVLIVASDGQPHASGYGGRQANQHTAQMVQKLEMQGMFVCQIAMENFNSAEMFTNFVPYDKNSLGVNLKKVLLKKLVEISNLV